mmetsp:Transcript_11039/g.24752  ORF Transcript_11039/g.24752 Transcript_11039/m.24752 type:complete len:299 (+) Transcript_11039:30-926(+)
MRTQAAAELLGVTPGSSPAEVRRRYLAAALRLHPDKAPEDERDEATIRFQAVQLAYQILSPACKVKVEYEVQRTRSLSAACTCGDLELVEEMMGTLKPREINAVDATMRTPLLYACASQAPRAPDVVRVLVANRADLEERGCCQAAELWGYGYTPLMVACTTGRLDVARVLIVEGANVEAEEADGKEDKVLALAAGAGRADTVQLLVESKAAISFMVVNEAARAGHLGVLQLLLEHKADIVPSAFEGATNGAAAMLREAQLQRDRCYSAFDCPACLQGFQTHHTLELHMRFVHTQRVA